MITEPILFAFAVGFFGGIAFCFLVVALLSMWVGPVEFGRIR